MGLPLETPLTFLGVGIPLPTPSLGLMIADGREILLTAWWVSLLPLGVVALSGGAFLAIVLPIRRIQKSAEWTSQLGTRRIQTEATGGEPMTACPQCGGETRADLNFCSQCGAQVGR